MSTSAHSSHNMNPASLANLRPWQPGVSPNPGGSFNNSPKLSNAYARLMRMDDAEYDAYTPKNKAEKIAKKVLDLAESSDELTELINALKEIADRTEGKPLQTKVVEHTVSPETRQAVIAEAYYRLFNDKDEDEAIASIRAIYAAKQARDEAAMRQAVVDAIQADSEAISAVWESAAEAVAGGK